MWEIVPRNNVGPITLGMHRDEVIKEISSEYSVFKRTPETEDVLAFDKKNIHVTIGPRDRAIAISIFPPNEVLLTGSSVIGYPLAQVEEKLNLSGGYVEHSDVGLWCPYEQVMLIDIDGIVGGVELGIANYFF